jgi:hypothetical protein
MAAPARRRQGRGSGKRFLITVTREALVPLLPLLLGVGCLAASGPLQAQDLVGCSLLDGQLSCMPGVPADPQAQIRALRQAIAADLARSSAVQQQIDGLQTLMLAGEARQGSLLVASLAADALAGLPPESFHWYRLRPGAEHWVWIDTARGPSYQLTAADVNSSLMLVVVRTTGGTVSRQATAPVGPIAPAP